MEELRKPDYDLRALFEMGHGGELKIEDIKNVLAQVPGEADELNWHWIVALKDGGYAYITGGCDYSGWGCQDWGSTHRHLTPKDAAEYIDSKDCSNEKKSIKQQLLDQLEGKQPYGLREE